MSGSYRSWSSKQLRNWNRRRLIRFPVLDGEGAGGACLGCHPTGTSTGTELHHGQFQLRFLKDFAGKQKAEFHSICFCSEQEAGEGRLISVNNLTPVCSAPAGGGGVSNSHTRAGELARSALTPSTPARHLSEVSPSGRWRPSIRTMRPTSSTKLPHYPTPELHSTSHY